MPVDRNAVLEAFGETVRRRRRELGMSQEGLAEVTGLHRTYIGSVERGERNPTLTTLLSISLGLKQALPALLAEVPAAP